MTPLRMSVLPGRYAVCRLPAAAPLSRHLLDALSQDAPSSFLSLTRTDEETSLVLLEGLAPAGSQVERGWRCLKLLGPLDFSLVGILARITAALAGAGISLFALSTYDTDYLLVREGNLTLALQALEKSGIIIEPPLPFA